MSDKCPFTVRGGARNCWCLTCWPVNMIDDPASMRMALCSDCGSKRCPKANNCANACTGSNEAGQPGSSWENVAPRAKGEVNVSGITAQLIALLRQRDAAGLAKYGTTLDRTDLTPEQWLQHMAEELLDGAGYALAAMREVAKLRAELAKKDAIIQQLRAR